MSNNPNERKETVPSSKTGHLPDRGAMTDPNPGERSSQAATQGAPLNSLGLIPARGNRAGGGQEIDLGAQVGVMRNMEFTAGGRDHRLITGAFSHARPTYDPKSERMHVSTATDSGDPSIGPRSNAGRQSMPEQTQDEGASRDASTGDTSPDRRRDTKTT